MSAVPYAAPWQTEFHRYSTQLYTPSLITPTQLQMVIPTRQWWRIVYINGEATTVATAGNRVVSILFTDAAGNDKLRELATLVQVASGDGFYLFGPTLTAFANSTDNTRLQATTTIPDLLWPEGTQITLSIIGAKSGDTWSTLRTYAVEVYTEDRNGDLVPLTPTPLIP